MVKLVKRIPRMPNLKLLNKHHEYKWVALSKDYKKILAVADTLETLAKKTNLEKTVVNHVLPFDVGYAPHIST